MFITGCSVVMEGGEIYSNDVGNDGGGVRIQPSASFEMKGGEIFDNDAGIDGGGISALNLETLEIGACAVIANNKAHSAYQMTDPKDIALYNEKITTPFFSQGFEYAYNNYDIGYTGGTEILPTPEPSAAPDNAGSLDIYTKVDTGGISVPAGVFKFGLFGGGRSDMRVANDAAGNVVFHSDCMPAGTYTLKQTCRTGGCWIIDPSEYTVTVELAGGKPEVTYDTPDGEPPVFHNERITTGCLCGGTVNPFATQRARVGKARAARKARRNR